MTSPLRRAREEVAVNIAVTGFVARLLPTKTKELATAMEDLKRRIGDNNKEITAHDEVLKKLRREGKENTEEYQERAEAINKLKIQNKGLRQDIANNRSELRSLSAANADSLNKIRGFGIALGVSALALGGFSAGVVKAAANVFELEISAFSTGRTIQALQRDVHRYTVALGDSDMGHRVAVGLSELNQQLNLIQHGYGNAAGSLTAFARAGIGANQIIGATTDELREVLVNRLKEAGDNPVVRRALRDAVGEDVFRGVFAESQGRIFFL